MNTLIQQLSNASGNFLVALRENRGFDQKLFDELTAALKNCAIAWEGAEALPRAAVGILVDLVPSTQAAAEAYADPIKQRIYDASFELYDLISDIVGN